MIPKAIGPKVLLVEENNHLFNILRPCFSSHNVRLTRVKNISEIPSILNNKYSLLLLDIHIPDSENQRMVKMIREENLFTPIIAFGPKNPVCEIESFRLGINIYHSKPIHCELLQAQISQLISSFEKPVILNMGDIRIEIASHSFFILNKKIPLTYQEFHLLFLLIMAEGNILSKNTISRNFPHNHRDVSYAAIDTLISRIRKKLRPYLDKPLIKTEYKLGYRINPKYLKSFRIEKLID
ncbi:response regulator transcription factor [Patescibacteria group bacterium]|nr:response regulator transcription factor [Patescibacteria group bacterium]